MRLSFTDLQLYKHRPAFISTVVSPLHGYEVITVNIFSVDFKPEGLEIIMSRNFKLHTAEYLKHKHFCQHFKCKLHTLTKRQKLDFGPASSLPIIQMEQYLTITSLSNSGPCECDLLVSCVHFPQLSLWAAWQFLQPYKKNNDIFIFPGNRLWSVFPQAGALHLNVNVGSLSTANCRLTCDQTLQKLAG